MREKSKSSTMFESLKVRLLRDDFHNTQDNNTLFTDFD